MDNPCRSSRKQSQPETPELERAPEPCAVRPRRILMPSARSPSSVAATAGARIRMRAARRALRP